MSKPLRSLAALSAGALAAGLLYGAVAPVATAEELAATPSTDGMVAGIETVGPIPTIASTSGDVWPSVPPQVAVLPNGSILEGDFPLIYAKALKDFDSLPYRVIDLASRNSTVVAEGTMANGWADVSKRLAAGGLFAVEVDADGEWVSAGRFSVGVRGATGGPAIEAGGMSVSTVTGSVAAGWASRTLPSPGSSVAVGLMWNSGGASEAGLPNGWSLGAGTGSAWARLIEAGAMVEAVDLPAAPSAVRAPGEGTATVSFAYPADELAEVDRLLVATQTQGRGWKTVKNAPTDFAKPAVDTRIKVPASGAVRVRIGLDVGETVVWGDAARVRATAPVGDPVAVSAGDLATAGRESDVTPGDLPDVVKLHGWDGSELGFVRNPLGVYEQMGGTAGFRNSLSWVTAGVWEFTDTQGIVTRFRDGAATTVTSPDGPLSALAWDAQGRLTSVTDDIGGRISLVYQGVGDCPDWTAHGFVSAPTGHLCAIEYPDGLRSEIGYVDAGSGAQIGLIKDPGNDGSIWGWDARGRLVSSRSTLVAQVATIEPAAASVLSTLSYDAQGRAYRLSHAPASVGGTPMVQTIDFPTINNAIMRDWMTDPSVANAPQGRVSTSGTGAYSTYVDSSFDPQMLAPVRVRDSAGMEMSRAAETRMGAIKTSRDTADRVTRFTYNDLGLVTKTEGPVTSGTGMVLERQYDTEYVDGQDKPLTGLRALTYSRAKFGGSTNAEFWRSSYSRSALSAEWSDRPQDFSAQATGVWTPPDADDKVGSRDGWQFQVTASGGTTATLLVGTAPCVGDPCIIRDLPTGPKSVTLQISDAGADGWVNVTAAPVGDKPRPLADDEVSPGYALSTVASNNDVASGMRSESQTRYDFDDPASGRPDTVTAPGGVTVSFGYSAGEKSRQVSSTMPSGKQVTMSYWGVGEKAALPAVCGGETITQTGQGKSFTRQDGTAVTQYYDGWSRVRASVNTGAGVSETACFTYGVSGELLAASFYDSAGQLIESSSTTYAVGGDPRVTSLTVSHGPAAPVSPDTSVTSSMTVDLGGREISSTDTSGMVTTTEYDAGGMVSKVTQTPPAGSGGAALIFAYDYRTDDAALETVRVNDVLAATLTYDEATGALDSIAYADGVRRSVTRLPNGAPGAVTIVTPDARFTRISEERTTSDYGRTLSSELTVTGGQARSESRDYSYDEAGRLARSVITGTGGFSSADYSYAFDPTQAADCGSAYAGAGLDSLRTTGSRNGTDYRICYDALGRPVSSTDPLIVGAGSASDISYDGLGRVTNISGPRAAALQWGSGSTLTKVDEISANGTGLVRTVMNTYGGAIYDKIVTDDSGTSTLRYSGSHLFNVVGGEVTGIESVIYGLPGGAHVRTAPGATATLTIPGLDGSAVVTVAVPSLGSGAADVQGSNVGLADRFGPFGEPLVTPEVAGDALPTYDWKAAAAQETLPGTSSITLMGARPYHPSLGAFLAADPVLGSGNNLYGYTGGDPINSSDASGHMTDDDMSNVLLGAGAAATILGGLVGIGGATWVVKSIMAAQIPSQVLRWPGRVVAGFGALLGIAGAGAVGLGTYMKVKSSLGGTESVLAAIGASLAAVGVGYLAAVGTIAVVARMWKGKWPKARSVFCLGMCKKPPRPQGLRNTGSLSAGSEGVNMGDEVGVTMRDLMGRESSTIPGRVPSNSFAHVIDAAPNTQVTKVSTTLLPETYVVRQQTIKSEAHSSTSSEGSLLGGDAEAKFFQRFLLKQIEEMGKSGM